MNCIGIGKLLGHKFEARYSTEERVGSVKTEWGFTAEDIEKILEAGKSRTKTYCGDVCVRCGVVVNEKKA